MRTGSGKWMRIEDDEVRRRYREVHEALRVQQAASDGAEAARVSGCLTVLHEFVMRYNGGESLDIVRLLVARDAVSVGTRAAETFAAMAREMQWTPRHTQRSRVQLAAALAHCAPSLVAAVHPRSRHEQARRTGTPHTMYGARTHEEA